MPSTLVFVSVESGVLQAYNITASFHITGGCNSSPKHHGVTPELCTKTESIFGCSVVHFLFFEIFGLNNHEARSKKISID
jgi:hypothetical protein